MKEKILIIHQGALGDMILSLPCLHALRTSLPDCSFDVAGYPRILSLLHNRFYADSIISVDSSAFASLYSEDGNAPHDMQDYLRECEEIFVFGGASQEILLSNIKKISEKKPYRISTFPQISRSHVVDFQLEQIGAYGFSVSMLKPRLFVHENDITDSEEFLRRKGISPYDQPVIAVHPGSGGKRKNWPVENFLLCIDILYLKARACFLIIEGPADEALRQPFRTELTHIPKLFLSNLDLPLLAAIIKQCALYMGNDSGITHSAAALGTPTVALFGPTDPDVWGPRGNRVSILRGRDERQSWQWASPDEAARAAVAMLKQ